MLTPTNETNLRTNPLTCTNARGLVRSFVVRRIKSPMFPQVKPIVRNFVYFVEGEPMTAEGTEYRPCRTCRTAVLIYPPE